MEAPRHLHRPTQPTGPRQPHSTSLSVEQEAIVVAFRRHTLLPPDDCLYALQLTIPHLTRSALHRCLQRHGISRLPEVEGDKPARSKFKAYPIGYFHVDIAKVRTAEGRLYLFVAIDRTSKFAFTELHAKATTRVSGDFLRALIAAVPYRIHTVLTDNGLHFTDPTGESWTPVDIKQMLADGTPFRAHAFEYVCAQTDIDHRLTKPKHPWTNGQVERMNRTIKEATVHRYHYDSHDQLIPGCVEPDTRKVKASSSFLRKRTKKLLLIRVRVGSNGRLKLQKFLLLFSKRSAVLLAKGQPLRRLV